MLGFLVFQSVLIYRLDPTRFIMIGLTQPMITPSLMVPPKVCACLCAATEDGCTMWHFLCLVRAMWKLVGILFSHMLLLKGVGRCFIFGMPLSHSWYNGSPLQSFFFPPTMYVGPILTCFIGHDDVEPLV